MRSGSNVFKRLAAVAASCLLVTACATGPTPQNGDEFIAYYANNPFLKKDKVMINKPYAAVMASITPMVKKCYNEKWASIAGIAPVVRVENGVINTGKIVTKSKTHLQVTIQQRDVTVHYASDTPPDGAYIFVANVKAAGSGSTSLEIYSSLSKYRDRLVEAANGKTPRC
jgi:hypothetical protein